MMVAQGSPEWLALRAGCMTASCFDAVLMERKTAGYQNYLIKLALERVLGKPVESGFKSNAMKDGTEREPIARARYETATGNMVQETDFIRSKLISHCGFSPDGLIDDDGGYESKCPIAATHYRYLQLSTVPAEYKPQVQGSLMLSGRQWWDFVSYHPDFPEALQLKIIRVLPDLDYHKTLRLALLAFNQDVEKAVANMQAMQTEREAA